MVNPYPLILRGLCRAVTSGCHKHVSYEMDYPLPPGPKVFASGHPTNIDPAYFYHLMGDPVIMLMNWGFGVPLVGRVMRRCEFIPVGKDGHQAYAAALNALLLGRSVYICPEGKLSNDGAPAKTGAVRLSLKTGHPIIPIGIRHEGRVYFLSVGGGNTIRFVPFGHTYINFGEPFHPELYRDHDIHWMTRRLMQLIKVLSE